MKVREAGLRCVPFRPLFCDLGWVTGILVSEALNREKEEPSALCLPRMVGRDQTRWEGTLQTSVKEWAFAGALGIAGSWPRHSFLEQLKANRTQELSISHLLQ